MYDQKKLSLIESDALLPVKNFNLASGAYEFDIVTNLMAGEPVVANGQPVPKQLGSRPVTRKTMSKSMCSCATFISRWMRY